VLIFAFTQGVFPKPPDFSKLSSFDISYLASHFKLSAVPDHRPRDHRRRRLRAAVRAGPAFWSRVRQGVAILSDRPALPQAGRLASALAWVCRFVAFWFLLDAFRVGGSVNNVLLVFGVNQVAGAVPFTPGGAGVQQALLVKVFATSAPTAVVAAYSWGSR